MLTWLPFVLMVLGLAAAAIVGILAVSCARCRHPRARSIGDGISFCPDCDATRYSEGGPWHDRLY
jgi:hypothetical protein